MKKIIVLIVVCVSIFVGCSSGIVGKHIDVTNEERLQIEAIYDKIVKINEYISNEDFDLAVYNIDEIGDISLDSRNIMAIPVFLDTYYEEVLSGISYDEYVEKTKDLDDMFTDSAIKDIIISEDDFVRLNIYLAN